MAKTIKQLVFNGQAYQFHAANVNNYDDTDVKNRLTTLETNEANLLPLITFDDFKTNQYDPLKSIVSDYGNRIQTIENMGYQTELQVDDKIRAIVGAAPEALDTLEEIAAKLNDNENVVSALVSTIAGKADNETVTSIGNRVGKLERIDHTKYLTEHQDLSDYPKVPAMKEFVTNYVKDVVEDVCEAITQEEYDALSTKKTGKLYLITD